MWQGLNAPPELAGEENWRIPRAQVSHWVLALIILLIMTFERLKNNHELFKQLVLAVTLWTQSRGRNSKFLILLRAFQTFIHKRTFAWIWKRFFRGNRYFWMACSLQKGKKVYKWSIKCFVESLRRKTSVLYQQNSWSINSMNSYRSPYCEQFSRNEELCRVLSLNLSPDLWHLRHTPFMVN